MKNGQLDNLKQKIINLLAIRYGTFGLADSDNVALLNFGDGDDMFTVTIKDQSAIDAAKKPNDSGHLRTTAGRT